MSEPIFTKGPWRVEGEDWSSGGHYDAPKIFSFADVDNPQFVAEIAVRSEWEANAHLMAAAPELYEALKQAEHSLLNCYDVCDYPANGETVQDQALAKVRVALAAARGEKAGAE